jgi:hypothetical protein
MEGINYFFMVISAKRDTPEFTVLYGTTKAIKTNSMALSPRVNYTD